MVSSAASRIVVVVVNPPKAMDNEGVAGISQHPDFLPQYLIKARLGFVRAVTAVKEIGAGE